jgi:hypothetical protein
MEKDTLCLPIPQVGQFGRRQSYCLQKMVRRMPVRREWGSMENLADSGTPEILSNGGILHPNPRGIEPHFRDWT